jgi:AcrR family transcriptional regulator
VLQAAREPFSEQGYAATGVGQIAARAGVVVNTVDAAGGRKPALLRELVETSLSGTDDIVPAEERAYLQRVRAADTAREKIAERRASNMRLFAADLRSTGELRDDLTDDEVADVVWSMNAADFHALLVGRRGWSAERFGEFLTDAWTRLLLA